MENFGCILLILATVGFIPTSGVTVTSFPSIKSTCQYSLTGPCTDKLSADSMFNRTTCYDGHLFETMCELFAASCHGDLRENVKRTGYNSSCEVILYIQPEKTSLSPFLERTYNAAVAGIDRLLMQSGIFRNDKSVREVKQIFTTQNYETKVYNRNTDCWAYPLDLTSISPWNSQGGNRKAGVLITPRHALWAKHYTMHVNTTLRFVDKKNNVIDRRIVKTKSVPIYNNGSLFLHGYDIVIGELDFEVPASISYSKVLPKTITKIEPLPDGVHVPVFSTDFEENALVSNIYFDSGRMAWLSRPNTASLRYQFYETKIVGDSGSPVFLVLNGEPVLLFVLTYGAAGAGTSITYHYDDINVILKEWGTGYQLTEIDLTQYMN